MIKDSVPTRHLWTTWGSRTIEFTLAVEPRRDLVITVHPDLRVQVRAPHDKPLSSVLHRVRARRSWIARQLVEFEQMTPVPPPKFVSGETVMYLGREYRLRVRRGSQSAVLHRGRLYVCAPGPDGRARVRAIVLDWFKQRSHDVYERRLSKLQSEVALLHNLDPVIRVRQMARRWGSCSPHGLISLNPALIQAPVPCVDYVLAHELLHMIEPSHSPRFYRTFDRVMPDWRERRQRLARAAVRWE